MNGPTFGWLKMLSIASLRSCDRVLAGRQQRHAVQQRLGADVVLGLVGHHRVEVVRDAGRRRGAKRQPVKTRAKSSTVAWS